MGAIKKEEKDEIGHLKHLETIVLFYVLLIRWLFNRCHLQF